MMHQPHRGRRPIITPTVYGSDALEPMRRAGRLTAQCLRHVVAMVAPGVTTKDLDDAVSEFCAEHNVQAATLGYGGFPAHCCTSVNHVAAHGVPTDRPLQDGDIVSIDVALNVDGWFGDTCTTCVVDNVSVKAHRLLDAAHFALWQGIKAAGAFKHTGDIGHAISEALKGTGCTAIPELCGHGIGRSFHDLPNVLAYGEPGKGTLLVPGMFITVEPIVVTGSTTTKTLKDGAVVTRDRSLAAQFEHTLAITENGVEVLTL